MAANRFIPLVSSQSGAVPTASALFPGELALNIADGRLFTRSGSAILLLNDTTLPLGTVSSSAQVIGYIDNNVITPAKVESNEFKLVAGTAMMTFTGSITSGVFGSTEYVYPFLPTSSFSGATIDYIATRQGSARIGVIMALWSGSQLVSTDVSTADIGDTSDIRFGVIQADGYTKLRVESAGSGSYAWTVQTMFKLFPSLP
jgi:hypothetical protein